ncbi:MAG: Ig-like domain-containing protein [Clostridia bacterium]|nr:Ig-like domain-containing protein [Clostridia bacterium]
MSKSKKSGIYKYEPLWGEWYVDSLIGKGSFGEVYRIYKTVKGRRVEAAAKYISVPKDSDDKKTIYSSGLATDDKSFREVCDERAESMTDEINLMLGLQGLDNIVSYEDHIKCPKDDEIGWDIIIRMELLTSLDKYLENNDFYLSDVLRLGVDLCRAIDNCHKNGITHRDVKIENIFVDRDGHFKLGDFGVSRMSSGKTTKGTITGTEEYMAPEMLKKEKYNNTVDIYSLGLVLYRLLNNKRMPFLPSDGRITISDVEAAANSRLEGNEFPSPHYADEELNRIINKACAYDKHERYQSATEMAEDLEKVVLTQDVLVLKKRDMDDFYVDDFRKRIDEHKDENEKKKRKVLFLIPIILVVFGLLIGGWFLKNKTTNAVTDITGLPETVSIVSGDSLQLKANVLPAKAEQVVVYSSSYEAVVSVDETGKIIANSAGKAIVTASAGSYSEQIEISVASEAIPVENIVVQENISMPVNATVRINTKIIPENATYTSISYSSSNNEVVSVDESGNATAKSVGEAAVFVKVGEVSKTIPVKVEKIPVTDLNGLMSNIELEVGKTHNLDFTVVPEDATNTTVTFESSDNGIVSVDENGNVVANKVGSVTVTVTCDDIVKTVTVIVKEKTLTVNPTEDQPLTHVHSYGAVDNEPGHPHKEYKLCSSCGHKEYTGKNGNESSCTTCNPPHVHSYGAVQYENEHPHEGYKECSCGAIVSANNNQKKSNCSQCYPCDYCDSTAHLTKNHPVCSDCGSKNHTTYEHDESDGWVSSLPSYVKNNRNDYEIEEAIWYSYSERQTTTRTNTDYLSGWDLYDTDVNEGSWSAWQENAVQESSTREVRTKMQYGYYHYALYFNNVDFGTYPVDLKFYNNTELSDASREEYHEVWVDSELAENGSVTYFNKVTKERVTKMGYKNTHCSPTKMNNLYYLGKRTVYQYKDTTYTYYFEKWSDYTDYSPTKVTETANRDVKTKTYYYYVLK